MSCMDPQWYPLDKRVLWRTVTSYASYVSVLNASIAHLPLPFSIIPSKHIFEVGVQILFGFSMILAIDLFQCMNGNLA